MKEVKQLKEDEIVFWLAQLRQEKGISAEVISKKSGLGLQLIRNVEQKGKAPSKTIFWKYVKTVCQLTGGRLVVE